MVGNGGEFGDGLETAEFVVGMHDGDEVGVWTEGGAEGFGGD